MPRLTDFSELAPGPAEFVPLGIQYRLIRIVLTALENHNTPLIQSVSSECPKI